MREPARLPIAFHAALTAAALAACHAGPSVCERAAAHAEECLGEEIFAAETTCSGSFAELAEDVLARDCDDLGRGRGKADTFESCSSERLVTRANLNLRRDPSLEQDPILVMPLGATVHADPDRGPAGPWLPILYEEHRGWAHSFFLECPRGGPGDRQSFENRVGWAFAVHPGMTRHDMRSAFQSMKDHGANIVYISHANPGEPDAGVERGMTYSVFHALVHDTPLKGAADEIVNLIDMALEESSAVGIDVVLAIGYQIQMGREWNAAHGEHLRLNPGGDRMNHWSSGETASPYSPQFRADLRAYYEWIDAEFVRQHPHIVALNLADEPMGSDFSPWAKAEFEQRHGMPMETAPDALRGRFLSGVLADYATLAANFWQSINSDVWVLMTFHIERELMWFPDFEAIFAQTPDNFVFSADTHYHDKPWFVPMVDLSLLRAMVRTIGWYSKVYDRPIMLWSSANRWGLMHDGDEQLAQDEPDASDQVGLQRALENLRIVELESRRNGGHLAMIMAWGYNILHQGVFNVDPSVVIFDPQELFAALANALAALAPNLSEEGTEVPSHAIVFDRHELETFVGANRLSHLSPPLVDLVGQFGSLLRDENTIVVVEGRASEEAEELGASVIDPLAP